MVLVFFFCQEGKLNAQVGDSPIYRFETSGAAQLTDHLKFKAAQRWELSSGDAYDYEHLSLTAVYSGLEYLDISSETRIITREEYGVSSSETRPNIKLAPKITWRSFSFKNEFSIELRKRPDRRDVYRHKNKFIVKHKSGLYLANEFFYDFSEHGLTNDEFDLGIERPLGENFKIQFGVKRCFNIKDSWGKKWDMFQLRFKFYL